MGIWGVGLYSGLLGISKTARLEAKYFSRSSVKFLYETFISPINNQLFTLEVTPKIRSHSQVRFPSSLPDYNPKLNIGDK